MGFDGSLNYKNNFKMDNNVNGVALLQIYIDEAMLNSSNSLCMSSQLDKIPFDELQQLRAAT